MSPANIIFIDNSIHRIFKSLDILKGIYQKIQVFNNEKEALDFVYTHPTDIIFLNLDLLPNDALTVSKEIFQKKPESKPFVVIYSDKQDDFIYELAFNSGVDSFINFHNKPAVLQLFIRNLLSRRKTIEHINKKAIAIDRERFVILNHGEPVHLPKKEFKLFELLFSHPQKFFSKTEIASEIWDDTSVANKRIIDVHIYNIRRYFGKRIIQSQKGKGYRINSSFI
jgi:two-component system, OmpR family, alkaline phosphatase synthesis response regulator PhoP